MRRMRTQAYGGTAAAAHAHTSFRVRTVRRHVDLLRVNSALCPRATR